MAAIHEKPALVLDTKGLLCPMPVIKTSQSIRQVKVGEVLELLATDPGSKPDISAWARMTGNELVSLDEEDGNPKVYKFYLRRMK